MAAAERELDSTSSNLDFVRSLARHRGYIVSFHPLFPPVPLHLHSSALKFTPSRAKTLVKSTLMKREGRKSAAALDHSKRKKTCSAIGLSLVSHPYLARQQCAWTLT